MSTNNTTPPNAIDLALDALREYEQQDEIARNADHEYRRDIAGHQAEVQRNRAAILAQIAVAQALVAVANKLDSPGHSYSEVYEAYMSGVAIGAFTPPQPSAEERATFWDVEE